MVSPKIKAALQYVGLLVVLPIFLCHVHTKLILSHYHPLAYDVRLPTAPQYNGLYSNHKRLLAIRRGPPEVVQVLRDLTSQQQNGRARPVLSNDCIQYQQDQQCGATFSEYDTGTWWDVPNSVYQYLFITNPATSLLVLLNAVLFYVYWDRRVDPDAVSLILDKLWSEPWRSFTGTTAHFEIWHVGINMMSLIGLGGALERNSAGFLYYNISLMALIPLVWMGLQKLLLMYRPNYTIHPTVGYSGVLFAWMVVSSLENTTTCPIYFMHTNLCFTTYRLPFRFNLAPFVQLVLLQFILPRISFVGHLSGILVGFVVYWGFLPIEWIQPSILLPTLHGLHLEIHKTISFEKPFWKGQSVNVQIWRGHVAFLILSVLILGPLSGFSLSFLACTVFWTAVLQRAEHEQASQLAKGYTIASVLTVVNDGLSLGSWMAIECSNGFAVLLILLRMGLVLFSVYTCHGSISANEGGIFWYVFGRTVLRPCRILHDGTSDSFLPLATTVEEDAEESSFVGSGQRLGETSEGSKRGISRLLQD